MRVRPPQPTVTTALSGETDEPSQLCTILEAEEDSHWRRGWGLQSIGAPNVLPHFAIRITEHTAAEFHCLVLGVTSVKSVDASASNNGMDGNCYALFSSPRAMWSDRTPFPKRGIIAMQRFDKSSRLLATEQQMQLVDTGKPGVVDTSGFMIPDQTVVVGVVCDLEANTIRFYVNDQILRVTADQYSYLVEPRVDKLLAVGDPFVWTLPSTVKLSECYPYLCVTDAGITAEFIEWTPPSASSHLQERGK